MRLMVAIGVSVIALAGMIALLWLPLPGAKARDATGETRTVERAGRTVTYHVQGEGPPIVLLASAGREASDFNELASALVAAGYRTLAVDPPGAGDLWDMADDVAAVITADGGGPGARGREPAPRPGPGRRPARRRRPAPDPGEGAGGPEGLL